MTDPRASDATLHLRFGWWALLAFLCLGIGLEALHGFKIRFYLDVSNEARRLLWTLAHAHGVLLALVNIAFALSLRAFPDLAAQPLAIASRCLIGAAVLLPVGFFLGGATEVSVQDIVEQVGTSQSNISQHLSILRDKGILASRKDANRVYYRVGDSRTLRLIGMMREVFCEHG